MGPDVELLLGRTGESVSDIILASAVSRFSLPLTSKEEIETRRFHVSDRTSKSDETSISIVLLLWNCIVSDSAQFVGMDGLREALFSCVGVGTSKSDETHISTVELLFWKSFASDSVPSVVIAGMHSGTIQWKSTCASGT